jgi:hypothetical protein
VIRGAEASNLGAAIHGAELRVHFLKSFQEGRICEILSQKGPKNKKVGWLVAGGWFVVREKYCWLVADKPSEQGVSVSQRPVS